VTTNRDAWVYNHDRETLAQNVARFIDTYNTELLCWNNIEQTASLDDFLLYDSKRIKWSSRLKECLLSNKSAKYQPTHVRRALYRPFCVQHLYFDEILTHRRGLFPKIFPLSASEVENVVISVPGVGNRREFGALVSQHIVSHDLAFEKTQCFPFYTYAEDGSNRRENITDWALEQFRARYHDPSISKWDIFHYIYAVLHHPEYRERYAANLRRELPRIPFVSAIPSNNCHSEPASAGEESAVLSAGKKQIPRFARNDKGEDDGASAGDNVFRSFVRAGERLAEIHVHYEKQSEYPLTKTEKAGQKLDWRVTKMRLSKDKTLLIYNQFLTLSGIPKETYDYRLGNRSALEWVIDQYQVSTDKRSGITNDPNRDDDRQYILRLIGQVITVSLETVSIVNELPALGIVEASGV
jgi:predicted helicase